MGKKLSEMTLEELWQLFPIILSAHRDEWTQWYEDEKAVLLPLLPENSVINHIGSTAIKNIWAKPIIDIMIELPDSAALHDVKNTLSSNGYIYMSADETRISLNKGYTENGFAERVFHIHLRIYGDNDEIIFRDYLNANPDIAEKYERLKLELWKKYEHDRDGYTEAKTGFVLSIVEEAKKDERHELGL